MAGGSQTIVPQEVRAPQISKITQIKKDARSYAIIGAAMEVHRELGSGYLESIYHQALALEFHIRAIQFQRGLRLPVTYKGQDVGTFRADFLCFETVIVEIKANGTLSRTDYAQVIHYLTAASISIRILLNFGSASLQYRRIAC